MNPITALALLLIASLSLGATELVVPAAEGPLAIDGRIDEEIWQKASVLPLERHETRAALLAPGELRAIVKGAHLCLSARLPESGQVVVRSTGAGSVSWRETADVVWWRNPVSWREDVITWSFRFRSAQGRNVLLTLAVNALGGHHLETTGRPAGPGEEVIASASIGSGEWSVEVAIPLAMLGEAGFVSAERLRPPRPDAPELRWTWPAPNDRLEFRLLAHGPGGSAPSRAAQDEKPVLPAPPVTMMPHRVWTDAERKARGIAEMVRNNLRARVTASVVAEKEEWERVSSASAWEEFRNKRLAALRASLGPFPDRTPLRTEVTRRLNFGDGFTIENVLYESRPGLVVTANLYLPENRSGRIPAIVVVHSHHAPRFELELQDMGMTWARAGTAVLVMDQLGAGERVQSQFWPGESYYSRYAMGMQLQLAGESLAKWMAWDLMRGIDMLLERPYIDPARLVMLGSCAGGGDPAALTAALDKRIAVVIPFNFGEASPEAHYTQGPRPYRPEFADPGWGSWETTRNLPQSISGQFFPWFICASVAPRRFVYAFEISWPNGVEKEPAWARYNKVFRLYGAREHLADAHGFGSFPGPGEFTNVGVNARKKIYQILNRWLNVQIPAYESHNLRPYAELAALTPAAAAARKPQTASKIALKMAEQRLAAVRVKLASLGPKERVLALRRTLQARLGDIEPRNNAAARVAWSREVEGHLVEAVGIETEPGIYVPLLLLKPKAAPGRLPAVIGFAQGGKEGFLLHRAAEVDALLKAGNAVCLVDVRGVGETAWTQDRGPGGMSLAATEFMLGGTMLGARLKDARTVYRYLARRADVDARRIATWGDSFAATNVRGLLLDQSVGQQPGPRPIHQAEPLGALLAMLTALYEDGVKAVAARRGLVSYMSVLSDRFTYVPQDAIVPGILEAGDISDVRASLAPRPMLVDESVDGRNCVVDEEKPAPEGVAAWLARQLSR
jgi:dienelactone hydrolase